MRRFWSLLLVIGFSLVLATGCWNPFSGGGDGNGGGGDDWNRLTRDNLMNFFANAYEEKNIDAYEESLHDKFLFKFTASVAESLGLPAEEPWWGKTQDVTSTRLMFEDPTVTDIAMHLDNEINWYACVDVRPHEDPPDTINGWCARFDPTIDVTINQPGEETKTLIVRNSWLNVIVTPDPKSTTGEWVIVRLEELEKNPG